MQRGGVGAGLGHKTHHYHYSLTPPVTVVRVYLVVDSDTVWCTHIGWML